MATITDKAARDAMVRARTNLLVSNGFFGFLALRLKLIEVTDEKVVNTMAVDGVNLYYHPKFVHSLSEREMEGVEAHEIMHCCFQHFSRRGHRYPEIWNMAGDFIINADLLEAGFTLPGQPITMKSPKGTKGHLYDPHYEGMTTEDVYELLMKDITIIKINFLNGGNGDGKGDPGMCGGVLDAPGKNQGEQEMVSRDWDRDVRTAVQVARGQNAGNVPGSLRHLVENLTRPKVNWRDKTRQFIDQSMTKDVSWARISRRSVSIGCLLPGLIADRLNHLIMIVDTSGSISEQMCREMVSEAAGALDEGTADQLSIVYADTDVQHVDHFTNGDIVKAGRYTGGGTAFSNSFKWVMNNVPEASCIIYLTDMQVYDWGDDPGIPVLWAVFAPSNMCAKLAERAPFGNYVHVSETS